MLLECGQSELQCTTLRARMLDTLGVPPIQLGHIAALQKLQKRLKLSNSLMLCPSTVGA